MDITIIGSGYVGLTTGAALAYLGHDVTLLDKDEKKINMLRVGEMPIHERGLKEVIHVSRERLNFISSWDEFDPYSDVVIIAVGTPSKKNGDADLSYVEEVAKDLGERIVPGHCPVLVNKSTVPIGSAKRVKIIVENILKQRNIEQEVHVASNPEFLREGEALHDTFYPDRIVIGAEDEEAKYRLQKMYRPLLEQTFIPPQSVPRPEGYQLPALIMTNPTSAELIKYAANSFLAMKISFINEFANLADQVGADITEVARGIGLDTRIGLRYLNAGIGWGGSCFGKDTKAISYTAKQYGLSLKLVEATIEVNQAQREVAIKKLQSLLKVVRGSTIGLLGLSFKPNTDDLRDAPSIDIIHKLLELGAHVKVYDPVAMEPFKTQFPQLPVEYAQDTFSLFDRCDAVVLVTEWEEFQHLPYHELGKRMKQRIIVDGRNVLNKQMLEDAGFQYTGIGR